MEKDNNSVGYLYEIRNLISKIDLEVKSGTTKEANRATRKMELLVNSIENDQTFKAIMIELINSNNPSERVVGCALALKRGILRAESIICLQELIKDKSTGFAGSDAIMYLDIHGTYEEKQILRDMGFGE